ncbi:hypothetical protein GBAR_LOCUS27603 [Geodia barretti]|uniref:Uncharacterized protein n=1 Tax=Geodia barretti TaxID=519541 RepID=A0AA35TM72_GEOBA|nr:hypothetical protein GBAR_LOCUS27603 [Geodia barretti]
MLLQEILTAVEFTGDKLTPSGLSVVTIEILPGITTTCGQEWSARVWPMEERQGKL